MSDVYNVTGDDPAWGRQMDKIKVMIVEIRYCGERIQQGTMTPDEARAWLTSKGHPGGETKP